MLSQNVPYVGFFTKWGLIKGQMISKCPFGAFKSPQNNNKISVLASKKKSNQTSSMREFKIKSLI